MFLAIYLKARDPAQAGPYPRSFLFQGRQCGGTQKRIVVGLVERGGKAHLQRYLAEFDFRYYRRAALKVTDTERAEGLLCMARDKRLPYRRIAEASYA